jgi:hypothetical protein
VGVGVGEVSAPDRGETRAEERARGRWEDTLYEYIPGQRRHRIGASPAPWSAYSHPPPTPIIFSGLIVFFVFLSDLILIALFHRATLSTSAPTSSHTSVALAFTPP